jgi:hypothetical protein
MRCMHTYIHVCECIRARTSMMSLTVRGLAVGCLLVVGCGRSGRAQLRALARLATVLVCSCGFFDGSEEERDPRKIFTFGFSNPCKDPKGVSSTHNPLARAGSLSAGWLSRITDTSTSSRESPTLLRCCGHNVHTQLDLRASRQSATVASNPSERTVAQGSHSPQPPSVSHTPLDVTCWCE